VSLYRRYCATLFADPSAAFEHSRQHLRRVFFQRRKGVEWDCKRHTIDAPYCTKVEFHGNEWAHFHFVFRTRRFVPAGLLNELWGLGRTYVRRITNERFRYLLKYVTKDGGLLPDWVRHRTCLRVFRRRVISTRAPPSGRTKTGRPNKGITKAI
jgi:hypothetical protein